MSTGYRLVIHDGGEHEDRSVVGLAGLEPDKPAMNEAEALRIQEILGGKLESFQCEFIVPQGITKGERVAS